MWVIPLVVVVLLAGAALCDWHARRHGRDYRTAADYWHAVREARRDARARLFSGGRRFGA